jgi:hypothetical protein
MHIAMVKAAPGEALIEVARQHSCITPVAWLAYPYLTLVCTILMVIAQVVLSQTPEVAFVEHDHMIE